MSELIAMRFQARDLELFARGPARAQAFGTRASLFRGRGLEFEEVRHYQAGDELRAIDWRVTARTGTAHTKLFREERERPVLLLVDLRPGMGFGSVRRFKSVAAADVTALLAWAALQNGDRVGGMVLGHAGHEEIRPARNRSSVLKILRSVHRHCEAISRPGEAATEVNAQQNPMSAMLAELRRVAKPGAGIFLLSDFADFDADCAQQLHLLSRHCDVNAIHFFDPLETALPAAGRLAFRDGQRRIELDTGDVRLREQYREHKLAHRRFLEKSFAAHRVALRSLGTDADPATQLQGWLHPRARKKAGKV